MQKQDSKPQFGTALPDVVILAGEVRTGRRREFEL
jgi:hypothetical protein